MPVSHKSKPVWPAVFARTRWQHGVSSTDDLDPRIDAAREVARQTTLEGIKTAGEKDWRALAEWLKLTFLEYRSGSSINVNATAMNDNRTVVVTEAKRAELQAKLKEIQDDSRF